MVFEVKATGERPKPLYVSDEENAFFSRRPSARRVDPKAPKKPYGNIVVRNRA